MKRIVGLVLILFPLFASAQFYSQTDRTLDRVLRHDTRLPTRFLILAEAPEEQKNWELDFGLSYTDNDGSSGNALEIPLSLAYSINSDNTLIVSTGAIRSDDGSTTSHGLDDVSVSYQYTHEVSKALSTSLVAGVIIPSGGDVGSTTAKQILQGGASTPLQGDWVLGASVAFVHVDETTAGVGNTGEVYAVSVGNKATKFKVKRYERDGTDGTTIGELIYDFSISRLKWGGELLVDHGFTSGHHDSSIELDFFVPF